MAKVKYSRWNKIANANKEEKKIVSFEVDGETIDIEVTPSISYTDQILLINDVINACSPVSGIDVTDDTPDSAIAAHSVANPMYLEGVFRAMVLGRYTNVDLSGAKGTLDNVWELVKDNEFWDKITGVIKDDIFNMYFAAYDRLAENAKPVNILANRILGVLNALPTKAVGELFDVLAQADNLELGNGKIMELLGAEDND